MEYRVNPDENYNRWVWVQAEPVIEDDEVVRIVGFTRDVTDRNRRERQLAVVDNLLRHNLRNDMTTILGQAELIVEDPDVDAAERAAVIRRVGEALLRKTEKQRETIHLFRSPACPTTVDVACAVDSAIEAVDDRHPNATFETVIPDGLVASAIGEIEVAFSELIENAVKHADCDDPNVRIAGTARNDGVAIEIADDCPPLPEFEYRVLSGEKETNDVYHSTGLGLWLVYWVVDLSDGRIEFSTDETGNTITVVLPRASGPTT
jgi:signal transduction histidine kinase